MKTKLLALFLAVAALADAQAPRPSPANVASGSAGLAGDVTGTFGANTVSTVTTQAPGTTGTTPASVDFVNTAVAGATVSPGTSYPANQAISGCGVEYVSGLTFTVGAPCNYSIGGVPFSITTNTSVTLTAADATNPRIDVIAVNNAGAEVTITGTPATPALQPTVDASTQLALTFVYVPANATTPQGITSTLIYDENTEWTCSASAHFNCASTNNPYHGTKDIEATTAVLGNNVTLVKPTSGTVNLATQNYLVFYIRSKATWPTTNNTGPNGLRTLSLFWLNGSNQVGSQVVLNQGAFGFNSSNTTTYQQIAIPVNLFGTGGAAVTTLKAQITGNGGSSSIGFYLDQISLQGGTAVVTTPTSQTRRTCIIDNDTQSATGLVAAQVSGRCVIPSAATIVEVDVLGGTGINGSSPNTVTGTSSVTLQKNSGGSTTSLLSGALATASGKACALTSTSGTCIFYGSLTSSASVTIASTALAAGDVIQVSGFTPDTAQTWYTVVVVYTIN